MNTKICCRCGLEKTLDEFCKHKGKAQNPCKECKKIYLKEYYKKNIEKHSLHNKSYYFENKERLSLLNKEYRLKNKDKIKTQKKNYKKENKLTIKENKKIYYENNKEEILNKRKKYYNDNKKKIIDRNVKYYEKNKEYLIKKANIRTQKKKKEDYIYRLKCQIRNMIKDCFKRKTYIKKQKSEDILGCNIYFFQKHLLQTYKNNYGYEWDGKELVHIDHIKPLKYAQTEEEVINLCHYTNLQLLKAKDNLSKSSKLDWELKK